MTLDVITFLPEAEEEIEASVSWYEHRRRGLGLEFIAAGAGLLARTPSLNPMPHSGASRWTRILDYDSGRWIALPISVRSSRMR